MLPLTLIAIKTSSATLYLSSLATIIVDVPLQKEMLTNHLNLNTVLEVRYLIQNIVTIINNLFDQVKYQIE
jgi:hypothetical protein